jgi:uncharacterized cupin superfamily protein
MTASETTAVDDLEILCERKPSPAKLEVLGIDHWPIWRKDVSEFPWRYDQPETCYILRGRFTVTPQGGVAREFSRGDLITFPTGLTCTWKVLEPVEKHYRLG